MKLRQSEIDRACNGWTVVVRPQSTGGVMVMTVHVESGIVWDCALVKNGEIQTEIRQQLRMMDKCGYDIPMADRSRHRTGEKMNKASEM
jgi:hypothetical protein